MNHNCCQELKNGPHSPTCPVHYPLIGQLLSSSKPLLAVDQDIKNKVYRILLETTSSDDTESTDETAAAPYQDDDDCQDRNFPEVTERIIILEGLDKGGYGAVYLSKYEGTKNVINELCVKVARCKIVQEPLNPQEQMEGQELVEGQEQVEDQQRVEEEKDKSNQSLFREAEIFRTLTKDPHENIIGFKFCCTSLDCRKLYLGLEYFKGKNLSSTVEAYVNDHTSVPTKTLHQIMLGSTAAVNHLQKLRIVHLDIKPHNILFNSVTEKLKFIDFGSAVFLEELDGCDMAKWARCCGAATAEYMAAEILMNNFTAAKPNSDVYSLGLLFYRIITLQRPWHHIPEIRKVRHEANKHDKHAKLCALIRKQYVDFAESLAPETVLQQRIIKNDENYFINNSIECKLVRDMLSWHPSDRPSCSKITDTVMSCDKEQRRMSAQRQMSRLSLDSKSSLESYSFNSSLDSNNPTTLDAMHSISDNSTSVSPFIKSRDTALLRQNSKPSVADIPEQDMELEGPVERMTMMERVKWNWTGCKKREWKTEKAQTLASHQLNHKMQLTTHNLRIFTKGIRL